MSKPAVYASIALCFLLASGCADDDAANTNSSALSTAFVSPVMPADISGGTSDASVRDAALFAWQEFIALNWPALDGRRDDPDTAQLFGDARFTGPLVWHTYRSKVEIYPGSGDAPPGFVSDASQQYGYDALPVRYLYADGEIAPCTGQTPVDVPAWINLDEVSQLLFDDLYAGVAADDANARATNSDPQRARFVAKANGMGYAYVADPATSYWTQGTAFQDAVNNFLAVANGNGTPSQLNGQVIRFPTGTIEVKGAWRPLTDAEQHSGRFYQTTVRYYEAAAVGAANACYREAVWGLVGFHIIHKTPTAPSYIFATFEQADNLLTADGQRVEDDDGAIVRSVGAANEPEPVFTDGATPQISVNGEPYCTAPGARLFYQELPIGFEGAQQTGLPTGGIICVNRRLVDIPNGVRTVNHDVHDVLTRYLSAHGLGGSPWLSYKLVNVQWRPFDESDIDDHDPDGPQGAGVFWLANLMLETDNTLQFFSGQINANGARTDLPANFDHFNPQRSTYQNVLVFDDAGHLQRTYNMGGCMGCHGLAAVQNGTDFSFILADGPVATPEPLGMVGACRPTLRRRGLC